MYCKQCGHRSDEKTEMCTKCGARLASKAESFKPSKPQLRWQTIVLAVVVSVALFVFVPRLFFRSELETMGPTDKLRFLRALDRSVYKRVGQTGFRLEGQTLVILWDPRWETLPEAKQMEIVRIEGRAWHVVGGDTTKFRVEGDNATVAEYRDGKVSIGAANPDQDNSEKK